METQFIDFVNQQNYIFRALENYVQVNDLRIEILSYEKYFVKEMLVKSKVKIQTNKKDNIVDEQINIIEKRIFHDSPTLEFQSISFNHHCKRIELIVPKNQFFDKLYDLIKNMREDCNYIEFLSKLSNIYFYNSFEPSDLNNNIYSTYLVDHYTGPDLFFYSLFLTKIWVWKEQKFKLQFYHSPESEIFWVLEVKDKNSTFSHYDRDYLMNEPFILFLIEEISNTNNHFTIISFIEYFNFLILIE